MELIDKAAVIAEIKKRIKYYQAKNQKWGVAGYEGRVTEGEEILDYINTLEVKEIDLDKEIKSFTENLFHKVFDEDKSQDDFDWDDITGVIEYTAKRFYELGLKAQKGE